MQFNAVVYPFLSESSIRALKAACIYFDKLFILNPITIVKDEWLLFQYKLIAEEIRYDWGASTQINSKSAEIAYDENLRVMSMFVEDAISLIESGNILLLNPFDEFRSIGLKDHFRSIIEKRLAQIDRNAVSSSFVHTFAGSELDPSMLFQVSKSKVEEILTDAAIVTAIKYDAIPLALEKRYALLYQAAPPLGLGDISEISSANGDSSAEIGRSYDSIQIVSECLTHELPSFDSLTFSEIAIVRQEASMELESFRIEMRKVATYISSLPSESNYQKEISDAYVSLIAPSVNKLRRKLSVSKFDFIKKALAAASLPTGIATFLASTYIGMPIEHSILLAGSITGAKASIETFLERKHILSENGLSVLIQLERLSSQK